MSALLLRVVVALLIPAMAFSWRHSRLVAAAIAVPFVANLVDAMLGPSLPPDHPARVLVPIMSALLGAAAACRAQRSASHEFVLGYITAGLGLANVVALPYFAACNHWFPVWLSAVSSLGFVWLSLLPERSIPCLLLPAR
ncbi:MAG TPA: hypothetical protein PKA58_25485 [Polyangium sp.]|nr:hypothetical protein [Polyangium sp.]